MRAVWRLAAVVQEARYTTVRSGVPLALSRRIAATTTPSPLLGERHYAQSAAAAVKVTDQGGLSSVNRPKRGEPTATQLELLVRDITKTIQEDFGGNDAWNRRLERVTLDLAALRRKRIGVIGDQLAMPNSMVSALLQDPISESSTSRDALLSRPQSATDSAFEISYGPSTRLAPGHLRLSSSWLQSSGCDIVELQSVNNSSVVEDALSVDALVVVLDPYRLWTGDHLRQLQPMLLSGRPLVVVVNGRLPDNVKPTHIEQSIHENLTKLGVDPATVAVHLVDSSLASKALDALAEGLQRVEATPSTRSRAFETFQHAYLQSNIGALQTSLAGLLPGNYQYRTALSTATLATAAASTTTASDLQVLQSARETVDTLRQMSTHAISHVGDTSVINRGIDGGLIEGGVDDEITRARQEIDQLLRGRFSWIGLIGRLRLDDIGGELASFITQRFGKRLERQIIFETGQLSRLQSEVDKQADDALRRLSSVSTSSDPHPLSSPILRNHLSTLSLAIPSFTPETLLAPLDRRRHQLVNVSVGNLQRVARKAALVMASLGAGGIFASWWIYVPPVAVINAPTAIGLGLLSVVASVALGQRRWDKAQQMFWKEWSRSTGMLRGDLQDAFKSVMDTRVVVKSNAAAEGLEQLISRRRERVGMVKSRLSELERRVRDLKDQL